MFADFQGLSKPLLNNQPVNVQKQKRFVIVNCAAKPKNLTKNFYKITKHLLCHIQVKWNILSHYLGYHLLGRKIFSMNVAYSVVLVLPPSTYRSIGCGSNHFIQK